MMKPGRKESQLKGHQQDSQTEWQLDSGPKGDLRGQKAAQAGREYYPLYSHHLGSKARAKPAVRQEAITLQLCRAGCPGRS